MEIEQGRVFTHADDSICVHCQGKIFRNRYTDDGTLGAWLHAGSKSVWCRSLTAEPAIDYYQVSNWDNEGGSS